MLILSGIVAGAMALVKSVWVHGGIRRAGGTAKVWDGGLLQDVVVAVALDVVVVIILMTDDPFVQQVLLTAACIGWAPTNYLVGLFHQIKTNGLRARLAHLLLVYYWKVKPTSEDAAVAQRRIDEVMAAKSLEELNGVPAAPEENRQKPAADE